MLISTKMRWLIIVVLVISASLYLYGTSYQKKIKPLASLSDLALGTTEPSQLANLPSYHVSTDKAGNQSFFFGQNAPKKYSQFFSYENKIVAYKLTNPLDFKYKNYKEYVGELGLPSTSIMREDAEFGFIGSLFASSGIIVFYHQQTMDLIEEWRIVPEPSQEILNFLFPPSINIKGH